MGAGQISPKPFGLFYGIKWGVIDSAMGYTHKVELIEKIFCRKWWYNVRQGNLLR